MVDSEVVGGESKSPVVNGCDVGASTLPVANGKVDVMNGGYAEARAIGNRASGKHLINCEVRRVQLKLDKATTLKQQLEFAKICVEVEAESSLLNSILVDLDKDNWDKCTRKVVTTEVVSDDYVVCDVLESLKVHVESEIAVEIGVDENLVSSGTVVENYNGSQTIFGAMQEFLDCIEELDVTDHTFSGSLFTWCNFREEEPLSRKLDRFLKLLMTTPSPDVIAQEKIATIELGDLCKAEERFLRQKSRIQLIKESDQNSAYCFRQMAAKNMTNTIHSLKNCHGDKLESLETISNELIQYFGSSLGAIDKCLEYL
ncbi:hypothetical protein GQ457_02G034160 [Hibiscus cannabinus]